MEVEGIKSKLTNTIFRYHLTGFGQDMIFNGISRIMSIVCSDTLEVVFTQITQGEVYYEDFLVKAKKFHLIMIEDHMTGFARSLNAGSLN